MDIAFDLTGFSQFNALIAMQIAKQTAGNDDMRGAYAAFDVTARCQRQQGIGTLIGNHFAQHFAFDVQAAGKLQVTLNHHMLPDQRFDLIRTVRREATFLAT
jgi:hypothetical protein